MPFVATWEGPRDCHNKKQVRQSKSKCHTILLICAPTRKYTNELIYKPEIDPDIENKMYGYQRGKGRGTD